MRIVGYIDTVYMYPDGILQDMSLTCEVTWTPWGLTHEGHRQYSTSRRTCASCLRLDAGNPGAGPDRSAGLVEPGLCTLPCSGLADEVNVLRSD